MKYLFIVPLFFIAITSVVAQSLTVTGKVVDEKGVGLPGVTVLQKGSASNGTATSIDGSYTITVPNSNAVLVFTFVGYQRQEIQVGSKTTLNVSLAPDDKVLEEVVVIGYAEVNRRDLTGSVSSVGAKQLKDIPINSAAEALAGRLAGVQVTGSEGTPDANVQIKVRGGTSISQDNSPLYVVDGIQVENALSVLSPQDIESIDVLKDASATAIYGSRGANGVVIITTKGGREMKTTVSYNGLFGVRQLANKLDVMNPYEFVKYQYERSRGNSSAETTFQNTYGTFADIELYRNAPFVDWQDQVFGRDAIMQTHNVSVTGGTAETQFNLSLTSNKEEGIMLGSDFDRKLVNFRFDHQLSKIVKTGFNVRYNDTDVNGAGTATEGSSSVNRLRHSVKYRPLLMGGQGLYDYDQDYAEETNSNSLALVNPLLLTEAEYRNNRRTTTNLNGYVSLNLTNYLTVKSTLGVDLNRFRTDVFNDSITSISRQVGSGKPMASIDTRSRSVLTNSNVITFSNSKLKTAFSERNNINFMLGHEIVNEKSESYYIENRSFPSFTPAETALANMTLGANPQIPRSFEEETKLLSFFSRLNYSFDDKYLVTLTMRADGSSVFEGDNQWGYFPSASVAWRVLNENFMERYRNIFNDLKFRVSYGTAGNNRIDPSLFSTLFEPSAYYGLNNQPVTAFRPAALGNPFLKWETTVSRNIGLDMAFLNNRVQVTIDAYKNTTEDLLVRAPIDPTSGYDGQMQNIGNTSNRGVELQITGVPVTNRNFTWNTSFNLSFNKNKIDKYGLVDFATFPSGWAGSNAPHDYAVLVGQSVGTMWGLVNDGFYTLDDFNYENGVYTLKEGIPSNKDMTALDPAPGVIKYKDLTNDGIVNDKDRTVIGNSQPDFFGGLNNQVTYKNFDLSVFVNFQYGNDVLNANKLEFTSGYTTNSNMLSMMNNRWRNVNDAGEVVTEPAALAELNKDATLWSPLTTSTSFYVNSWAVEDGSFIRINNVTLGYTLPANLLAKARISKLRVYGTVNNLKVFTNYSGYDPEVSTRRSSPITSGVDYSAYPRSRAFIFGVNLTI
ncbi:TonB-dependent receptor [uncultured Pontibacter sp.]|uniref:SusC/RagA family TonB-linked outer membrane protein n=1 Tax=uncultured Pontibacter sp. TaxID=453356 RepID=UPI00261CC5EB|nr:TonB-dependent receptor [uncultured Pontibacter sp.]